MPDRAPAVSDSYPLYDIRLLQNFGRTDRSDEGFLFVPDGSGAVIRFDPADTRGEAVSLAVYGEDLTVTSTARRTGQLSTERVTLPVFGMADAGRGFLAIIEDGEANAYIEACRRGANNACNAVYPRFLVINKDNVYLEGASSESSKVPQFQQSLYDGAFQVRYILLNPDEEADGSRDGRRLGRTYLLEKGVLTDERVRTCRWWSKPLAESPGIKVLSWPFVYRHRRRHHLPAECGDTGGLCAARGNRLRSGACGLVCRWGVPRVSGKGKTSARTRRTAGPR